MKCPVWSQDKRGYLNALNGTICTPSVIVEFKRPITASVTASIQSLIDNYEESKCNPDTKVSGLNGLIIKLPYETHGHLRHQVFVNG